MTPEGKYVVVAHDEFESGALFFGPFISDTEASTWAYEQRKAMTFYYFDVVIWPPKIVKPGQPDIKL